MFLLIQATRKLMFLLQRSQKNKGICSNWCTEGLDHIAKKRAIIRQYKARAFKFVQHGNLVNFAVTFWHSWTSSWMTFTQGFIFTHWRCSAQRKHVLGKSPYEIHVEAGPETLMFFNSPFPPLLDPKLENTCGTITCFPMGCPTQQGLWRMTNAGAKGRRRHRGKNATHSTRISSSATNTSGKIKLLFSNSDLLCQKKPTTKPKIWRCSVGVTFARNLGEKKRAGSFLPREDWELSPSCTPERESIFFQSISSAKVLTFICAPNTQSGM